ncbi:MULTISPECIES: TonB-dependent receptor [Alteromonas]|uniref:TonB-dependent receptor n=1 Tax=Alteromonas TaxID=226 RepID=UPI00128796CA|nr:MULTISPECIES: TonB-dependent receptor [Alteromonas]CAI2391797.1 iron complex outermembrane recepter protein [Alteromonas macleodii]CAI3968400.1 iron complex outermembrane recepter protein [Alteromonas macleodii]CAI3968792.1 iron complex outermembrane recepter protein [Alteromonas macleodii]CAI3968799.1 iron complex outermembrane recepter protein [Alteromonas macleodii]VTO41394.1 iron complex outermembrane recepter protein [Alteromonas macleodii]
MKLSRLALGLSLSAPALLLASPSALAQTLSGTVTNAAGKPLANATVEIEALKRVTSTNELGEFTFSNVKEGDYTLHIFASGFAHLHEHAQVQSDNAEGANFVLARSAIEVIDVHATPMHLSVMESATPVSVLSGETLRRQQAATLGDTLEKLPGVQSNFHGNVASTPIIRGLSGPRVLITQNGLDVSDVSRVGPDHAVASEASTAKQIEVLRGPATLFFGSGAIGGVVNVVDQRVPTSTETRGEFVLETQTVNDQKLGTFNVTTGVDNMAFYADGFYRDSNDYETPVAPDIDDPDGAHVVENSNEESSGFTLGTSYLFDQGYVGVAVERFEREYGVPGHSHGGDTSVFADLEQTKYQLLGEYNFTNDFLQSVHFRAGYTDYEHAEVEGGLVGTTFSNETEELRVELLHKPMAGWRGGISLHYKGSDVFAQGEEAFTPPSEMEMFAVALMEERHFGDFLVQLGARAESVTLDASSVLLPELDAHEHDDEHDHDEHAHDEHEHEGSEFVRQFAVDQEFTPISLSAGVVYTINESYNVGVSLSRSERAPSASELLSFGPHIGTRTYEIGALFDLSEEGEFVLSQTAIDLETANNIDLTFRKTQGDVGFVFNAFYNQVDNYYFQEETGLFAESGHDHDHGEEGHGEEGHDEHSDELPVYLFGSADAILHGFELQVAWQTTDNLKLDFFADYVKARLKDGGALPRTSPMRVGSHVAYTLDNIRADLDITYFAKQDDISTFETETDGYTLVDASITYDIPLGDIDLSVYLSGENLTDEEARVHTSFLKDIAPRPGRNFAFGVRGYF